METDNIRQNLIDAGCSNMDIEEIIRQLQTGNMKDALHDMKKARCKRMDEMHECARKVDCLDYLIRNTQKQLKADETIGRSGHDPKRRTEVGNGMGQNISQE